MSNLPRIGSEAWRSVDGLDPDRSRAMAEYLDRAAIEQHERRVVRLGWLDLSPDQRMLDVGCGTGDLVVEMATEISPGTEAVGLDISADMIAIARQRAADVGATVHFDVGNAESLPYPDGSFDGVHCTRVLMHLEEPAQALSEMARVLRPGGRLVVNEPDWDDWIVDSDDLTTTAAIRSALAKRIRQPNIGRGLRRLAMEAGLEVLEAPFVLAPYYSFAAMAEACNFRLGLSDALEQGTVTNHEGEPWWRGLETGDSQGRFFGAFAVFTVFCQRPRSL